MGSILPARGFRFLSAKGKFFGFFFWSHNKLFIDQACSVKMAKVWPRFRFAFLRTETKSRSIKTQKKTSANIQPS